MAKVLNATWQKCRIRFLRNALACVGPSKHGMVAALLKTIVFWENQATAREQLRKVADQLRERFDRRVMAESALGGAQKSWMLLPRARFEALRPALRG